MIMIVLLSAVGAWAVFAHPLMGDRDPLTTKVVNPILGAFGLAPKVDSDGRGPVPASKIPCDQLVRILPKSSGGREIDLTKLSNEELMALYRCQTRAQPAATPR